MTDLNKRKTLKTIGVSSTVMTVAPATLLAAEVSKQKPITNIDNLSVNVRYQAEGNQDNIVFSNVGEHDAFVSMDISADINVPGGRVDLSKLMANGPLKVKAGSRKVVSLPRLGQRATKPVDVNLYSHSTLRFPISDNVIVGNVSISDAISTRRAPVVLTRLS